MEKSIVNSIRKFSTLLAPHKGKVILLLLAALIAETTTVGEKYIFKLIVDNGTAFDAGAIAKDALVQALLVVAAVFAVLLLLRTIARWAIEYLLQVIEAQMIADLKRKFFNHIVRLSLAFHTTHKTGSLISKLTRGSRAAESMMDTITFNFLSLIFQVAVVVISLAYVNATIVMVILLTVIIFIGFSFAMQQVQYPWRSVANDTEDIEKANIGDILTNIESVKYFAKEHTIAQRYHRLTEATRRTALKYWSYFRFITIGQILIVGVGAGAVVYFSMQEYLAGTMSLGTVVFIYTIYAGFISQMYSFINGMRSFYQSTADFESLYYYEQFSNDIRDAPGAEELHVKKGTVEFRNVSFTYSNRKILDKLNLQVKENQKVALVGPSGAGKSTVVKLLYRMYDVQEGEVLIDGRSIREFTQQSVRSELAIVPQEAVLFDDTIYNNILFSRPEATKEEVMQAMRFAQLDKIVANFPQGVDTIVGERGVKLSGGEKQRVSIARAILADKRILVLDEATSSLDSETEAEIQKDLQQLMKGRTSIIIAHRLSTIMNADRIVVIENGKVAQIGTHKQLIRQKGRYKKLWSLQKGGYIK